jgi:ribosomal protein S20
MKLNHYKSSYNEMQISAMMEGKSDRYKSLLKNIIRKIRNSIPSNDNKTSINNFISNAMHYDYKILDISISNYVKNAYMYEGKGFKYLLSMIKTFDEDKDKIFENEKKRFGTSPPVVIWDGTMEEHHDKQEDS